MPSGDEARDPGSHPHRRMVESEYVRQLGVLTRRLERNERAIAGGVQKAVTDGIREAVADKRTWDAFFAAAAEAAQNQAGAVTMGGIKWALRKAAWGLVLAGAVYAAGGWPLLLKFLGLSGKG